MTLAPPSLPPHALRLQEQKALSDALSAKHELERAVREKDEALAALQQQRDEEQQRASSETSAANARVKELQVCSHCARRFSTEFVYSGARFCGVD